MEVAQAEAAAKVAEAAEAAAKVDVLAEPLRPRVGRNRSNQSRKSSSGPWKDHRHPDKPRFLQTGTRWSTRRALSWSRAANGTEVATQCPWPSRRHH